MTRMLAPISPETEKLPAVESHPSEGGGASAAIEREVLEIVEHLAAELGSPRAHGAVGLDDSLDRDLAIDRKSVV